tara:strand:- start:5349 stop:6437 length:1089 start_codon:yes stop_codon:yes gene_type:complete
MSDTLLKHIPKKGLELSKYTGKEFVQKLGNDAVKRAIGNILIGGNVRDVTEPLTRERLFTIYATILITVLNAYEDEDDFFNNLSKIIRKDNLSKLNGQERSYVNWFVGLTGKSIQNVIRDNPDNLSNFIDDFASHCNRLSKRFDNEFGGISGVINFKDTKLPIKWSSMMYLFTAIGTSTLAIRGSEKSLYGKLFEKLILGSMLEILGFEFADKKNSDKNKNIFWLSSQSDGTRESDATILLGLGKAVRIDIGFIGRGNPEVSLDKVSRFEREFEVNGIHYYSSTIVIVDTIGEKSKIVDLAKRIGGHIIQMNMSNWLKEISNVLHEDLRYQSTIHNVNGDDEIFSIIDKKLSLVDFNKFINH